ncbi:MAG TPA: GAF domain-containing protein [Fimbriimonadales bacterium]|nr:GAF domain-containing protein [Fimbriimonadales bacterium]
MPYIEELKELTGLVLFSKDAGPVLYRLCEIAQIMTGAKNAMIAEFSENLGFMALRAGSGADWNPEMLGERIDIGVEEHQGITAYVAATGKTFIAPDVRAEKRYRKVIESSRSELAAPIFDRHRRVRGVLNVESDELDKFGATEKAHLELLAMFAGLLMDREDARIREQALLQVSVALDRAQTEEELLQKVTIITQKVMRVTAYSIFLWDEQRQAFVLRDTVGSSTLSKDAHYLPGEGCTGWVCQFGQPILLDDPTKDPRWRGRYLEFPVEEIASFLAVPILTGNRCLGCIRAIRRKPENPFIDVRFTEDDTNLLQAIAEQLGAGLEKIRSVEKLVNAERMAAWGELSARSAHMIGNRIFAMMGDLNELRFILSQDPIPREKGLKTLSDLQNSVKKLEEMLQDFRDFVTATKLNPTLGNINEVIRTATRGILPPDSPIELVLNLDESIPEFEFDAQKIERAISELVENATHFMEKGRITITTGIASEKDFLEAGFARPVGNYSKIVVEDEGPGIPNELKARIFDPYQTTRVRGMGLGLSIVKGIIDAHRGRIYECGEVGKGARFVILLPIHSNQQNIPGDAKIL